MRKARVDFELAATKWDLGVPRKEDLRREFWEKWAGELSVLFPADLSLGEGAVAIRAMVDQWRRDAIDKLMLKVREARREEMGPSTVVETADPDRASCRQSIQDVAAEGALDNAVETADPEHASCRQCIQDMAAEGALDKEVETANPEDASRRQGPQHVASERDPGNEREASVKKAPIRVKATEILRGYLLAVKSRNELARATPILQKNEECLPA